MNPAGFKQNDLIIRENCIELIKNILVLESAQLNVLEGAEYIFYSIYSPKRMYNESAVKVKIVPLFEEFE